jgi:CubicO group peptidase (beta-lactamase class C family)
MAAALVGGCQAFGQRPAEPASWPTETWRAAPPEAAGFRSDKIAEALLAIRDEEIPIHSLMLVRNGSVVADATFYPYEASKIHDLASVTKSVMTT